MDARAWRPCGACVALVPADDGCEHWQGTRKRSASAQRALNYRRRQAAAREAAK